MVREKLILETKILNIMQTRTVFRHFSLIPSSLQPRLSPALITILDIEYFLIQILEPVLGRIWTKKESPYGFKKPEKATVTNLVHPGMEKYQIQVIQFLFQSDV